MFRWNFRTFRLSEEASAEVDRAVQDSPRVEDEMMGVEWVLVREPEVGTQVAPDVYLYVNRKATSDASLITVLYTYNDDQVDVLRLWIR